MSEEERPLSQLLHSEIARVGFEHARDILLVICAKTGQIVDANLAAVAAYQYSREELLQRTIFEIREADPVQVPAQMQAANTHGILFESVHRRRDGTTFPVEVSSRGHTIANGRILLSVIRDITVRRQQEADRELMIDTTRRALAMRDEFLAIASHELRTPLTSASLKLQQLVRTLDRTESSMAVPAREALVEIDRLAALITKLLDVRTLETGVALSLAPTDLGAVVHGVVVQLRERAQQVGSEIVVDIAPVSGQWDALRLEQVFANLLTNALKYGQGRPVYVTGKRGEGRTIVEVSDHGIGIDTADSARVFEKFERALPSEYGGFGLGLYIARELVEAHGGRITLDSAGGRGSTFRVELPLEPATPLSP